MRIRSTVTIAIATLALGFVVGRGWSDDDKKTPTPEEQMAEMGKPAEQNKQLATSAGTWDCAMKMWMDPSAAPMEFTSVTTKRAAMNGLYVISEHKSEMMGQPFEGFGVDGYSKEKGKYFSFWADSAGTTPMLLWGSADASGKKITYDGERYECAAGNFVPRVVIVNDDADHMTFEFWQKKDGKPDFARSMEGKYTRRK